MSIFRDTLADVVRNSIADADASREDWESALTQVFGGEDRDTERYWIHDTLAEDQPDVPLPFGTATVGIVDEDQGGVFLYVHESNAQATLLLLRGA